MKGESSVSRQIVMKVCLVNTNSSLSGSGASWSYLYLLLGLKKRGVEVFSILPGHGDLENEIRKNGINCYVVKEYTNGVWIKQINEKSSLKCRVKTIVKKCINIKSEYSIKEIFKKELPDIVHMNAITGYLCAKVANEMNIKYVWHIRELLGTFIGAEFVKPEYAKKLMRESCMMIAISKACQDEYVTFSGASNIKVVFNGVSPDKFISNHQIFNSNTITIIHTGLIIPRKSQHELIQAVSILDYRIRKKLKIIIAGKIGDNDYFNQIVDNIKANHLEEQVEFIGYKSNVYEYVKKADITCLCSANEPFGRVTVEGMLAKCLVIGSDSVGTAEIIDNNINGLLYTPHDIQDLAKKIEWAIKHPEESRAIAQRGQNIALEKFTDDVNADNILNIYKSIMKN